MHFLTLDEVIPALFAKGHALNMAASNIVEREAWRPAFKSTPLVACGERESE